MLFYFHIFACKYTLSMTELSEDLRQQCLALCSQWRKLEATKLLNDNTDCGLETARKFIDELSLDPNARPPYATTSKTDELSPELEKRCARLIRKGLPIDAYLLLTEECGLSKETAKDYVYKLSDNISHGNNDNSSYNGIPPFLFYTIVALTVIFIFGG